MFSEIKSALYRSHQTLVQDALGLLALIVMLLVALYLPGGI
jgi:hypothetical protein